MTLAASWLWMVACCLMWWLAVAWVALRVV